MVAVEELGRGAAMGILVFNRSEDKVVGEAANESGVSFAFVTNLVCT